MYSFVGHEYIPPRLHSTAILASFGHRSISARIQPRMNCRIQIACLTAVEKPQEADSDNILCILVASDKWRLAQGLPAKLTADHLERR